MQNKPAIQQAYFPSQEKNKVIAIQHLNKSFVKNHVLRDFTLDVYSGENVVVLGKSGSGKSVLIKCIIGLIKPESGSINIFGKEITKLNQRDLDELRVSVGFLFQSNALYDSMTIKENLEFPMRRHLKNTSKMEVTDLVMEALTNVGLAKDRKSVV